MIRAFRSSLQPHRQRRTNKATRCRHEFYPGTEAESSSSLDMFFRSHETRPATSADLLAWLTDLRSLLHLSEALSHGDGAWCLFIFLLFLLSTSSAFWVDPFFLKEPHRGIEPWCGALNLICYWGALSFDGRRRRGCHRRRRCRGCHRRRRLWRLLPAWCHGLWIHPLFYFSLSSLAYYLLVVCCFCSFSGAEKQLMCTHDALLWNQVIGTNQFIFSVLTPLITWVFGRRLFLVLRYTHFSLLISVSMPSLARLPSQ